MPLINDYDPEASMSHSEDSHLIDIEEVVEVESSAPAKKFLARINSLDEVIKYYLDGNGHASRSKLARDQLLLLTVALTGAPLYAIPADDYAQSTGEGLVSRINYMVCTCLPALVVLYNSTELFLVMRRAEHIPEQLAEYLINPFTPTQKKIENSALITGAVISAVPLVAVSCRYPILGFSIISLITLGMVMLIDNAILHLFPLKLAFSEPLYRLPSLPVEFMIQQIKKCCLSQEEREKQQLQTEINQQYQAIKKYLINYFSQAERQLSVYGFRFSGCNYSSKITGDVANIKSNLQHSSTKLLIAFFNRLQTTPERRSAPSRLMKFFRTVSYIPGALLVLSSCSGFLAAPVNEMTDLTDSPELGAILSAPPVYFLGVLLAYFGGFASQDLFDYCTDWKKDAVKISMSFKLYPKTSILLKMISMYLSVFSYAAAAQLINDNFNGKLEFFRPYLLGLAEAGLAFLGYPSLNAFFDSLLIKYAHYFGDEDAQTAARLSKELSQIKDSIPLMKPNLLLDSLAQADESLLKSILNIQDENDLQILSATFIQLAEKLKTKIIKEFALMHKQDNDQHYTVENIEVLLSYLDTEPELNLSSSLKEVCQEYNTVCELIKKLGNVSLAADRGLNTFPHFSINDGDSDEAGSSSETEPLLSTRGPIYSNFFHSPYYDDDRASNLFPTPVFLSSNQMGM